MPAFYLFLCMARMHGVEPLLFLTIAVKVTFIHVSLHACIKKQGKCAEGLKGYEELGPYRSDRSLSSSFSHTQEVPWLTFILHLSFNLHHCPDIKEGLDFTNQTFLSLLALIDRGCFDLSTKSTFSSPLSFWDTETSQTHRCGAIMGGHCMTARKEHYEIPIIPPLIRKLYILTLSQQLAQIPTWVIQLILADGFSLTLGISVKYTYFPPFLSLDTLNGKGGS
ncbi:hypothetical protein VNO77_19954 [Canavalia gladiata]|uniref:Uncharacterized protein n=1 Tax=Canavalia gladiata TaxID=3824 RepID=A0AAN9LPA1_CANGL